MSLPRAERPPRKLTLGVSESILASWGPQALQKAAKKLPDLELEIHAHRSPRALDRVRTHELMLGLCAGVSENFSDLHAEKVRDEPLVLIPGGGLTRPIALVGKPRIFAQPWVRVLISELREPR